MGWQWNLDGSRQPHLNEDERNVLFFRKGVERSRLLELVPRRQEDLDPLVGALQRRKALEEGLLYRRSQETEIWRQNQAALQPSGQEAGFVVWRQFNGCLELPAFAIQFGATDQHKMIREVPATASVAPIIACGRGATPSLSQSIGRTNTGAREPRTAAIPASKFANA